MEPPLEPGDPSEEEMPDRVLWAGRQRAVVDELRERGESVEMTEGGAYFTVRRRQIEDAKTWCAARGISAQRSIFGSRDPSPEEIAAGCTRGAGAQWQWRLQREAEGS